MMGSCGRILGLQLPLVRRSHLSLSMPACVGGGNELGDGRENSSRRVECRHVTPSEGDVSGSVGREFGDICCGLRSMLSSVILSEKRVSLFPGHASQFMALCMPNPITPCRGPKISTAEQDFESFVSDVGATNLGDPSWAEDKCYNAWGVEPWAHSEQCNFLTKTTLQVDMRYNIEFFKGYMPSMHPVVMMTRSNSAMSEMERDDSCKPSIGEQTENCIDHLKEDMGLAQTGDENDHSPGAEKEIICISEASCKEEEGSGDPVRMWTPGNSRKTKQWWRGLLEALGMAVWIITGGVLVAKVIGVPNLGVGQNVAYGGFFGRSEDDDFKGSVQGASLGVATLTYLNFDETIMKRPTFVMFYAPWCPHCQRLHPVWEQLAGVLERKGYDVQMAIVDATKQTSLADKYNIVAFPSLYMFKGGHPVGRHQGERDIDTLISFIDSNK